MNYEQEQEYLQRMMDEVLEEWDDVVSDGSLEEDNVELQDVNTDSEQELGNPVEDVLVPTVVPETSIQIPSFVAKDGTKWRKHVSNKRIRIRADNIIKHLPGVKQAGLQFTRACEIWGCFFTDETLESIAQNTNIYITMKGYKTENRTARPTDMLGIKAFIGLLYIAGTKKNNHLTAMDLFRTNGTSLEIFRLTMSLARFQFLLGHIRFDDKRNREELQQIDRLAAIRELFETVNSTWPKYFSLSELTTVDEMLPAFRGRCSFRVYMPNKPNRYGIKIYALVDAKMFYCANLEIYVGKQHPGPYKVDTANTALLSRLCQPISGTRRNITMNNFFTSKRVADILQNDHKLTVVGTMRKNRPEIPSEFHLKRPEGTTMFAFQEKCTLVSYIPKPRKNVILLSTMHYDDQINERTSKPAIIMDYNATKGGVDVLDKMCEAYNCARGTSRWPMVVFYTLLNIAGINSYILHKNNKNIVHKQPRRLFLEDLGMELLDGHVRRRAIQEHIPRNIRTRLIDIFSLERPQNQPNENLPTAYGRCNWCDSKKNRKTKYSCRKCRKFMCLEHIQCLCPDCIKELE